jgi:signal transduction histidine kinase
MQAAGENLADGRVDNKERLESYGAHIYSEAVRLRKMIDRLLDVAKADAGDSFIHPKPVAVNHKVQEFIEEQRSYIKEHGFTLQASIPEHLPRVMVDEHSIETILSNLVSNAIKYSNESKFIGINLSKKGKDIILRVKDHGVGMSKNSIGHIFEKFYRAEDTLTAETKGYGLGLSIVKNLVELNGGSISVNSREGRGSTFTVTFPIIKETAITADENLKKSSSKKLARSTH